MTIRYYCDFCDVAVSTNKGRNDMILCVKCITKITAKFLEGVREVESR